MTPTCLDELLSTVRLLEANPLPLIALKPTDFDLPACRETMVSVRETLDRGRRMLPADTPDLVDLVSILANLYNQLERYEESEPLMREALESRRRVFGEDHPETLKSINNLATLYSSQGRYDDAEPLLREMLASSRSRLGDTHRTTLGGLYNLAALFERQGRFSEAAPFYLSAVESARAALPAGHWQLGLMLAGHGRCLTAAEQYGSAESVLLEALEVLETALGVEHAYTATAVESLADLYDAWEKPDDAAPYRACLGAAP